MNENLSTSLNNEILKQQQRKRAGIILNKLFTSFLSIIVYQSL